MINFDEKKERAEQLGNEWQFGAIETDLASVPLKDRLLYLPLGVLQFNNVMDSNGCASRAPLNLLETKLNWYYDNGMHPAIKKWCDEKGYREDGKFALNDAFIEILSGTTPQGNSLKAPVDAIRKYGVIPAKLIPLNNDMPWETYMNPKRVTQAHLDLGKEFLRRLTIQYEQVPLGEFFNALEVDLLDVAGHAWPSPVNGVYPRTEAPFTHAFVDITPDIDAFDTYEPFVKRLAKDYRFFEWEYSMSITAQNPYPNEVLTLFETLSKFGLLSFFAEAFRRLVAVEVAKETPPAPIPADVPYVPTNTERLLKLAKESLGTDLSPFDIAPDELGCAESISNLIGKVITFPVSISTAQLKECLDDSKQFERITEPEDGAIIVSPRTDTVFGHVGIFLGTSIASNNSLNGLFEKNYLYSTWIKEFKEKRGLRIYLWRLK